MEIILTKEQQELIEPSNMVCYPNAHYYYMPFVFEKNLTDGKMRLLHIDNVPEKLRDSILGNTYEKLADKKNDLKNRLQMLEAKVLHWHGKHQDPEFAEFFGITTARQGQI